MSRLLTIFGFILVVLTILVWRAYPDNEARLTVCDVGQGDALIVYQKYNQMIIDVGPPDNSVLVCLGNVMPFWDRKIESVIITHADSDHVGGLVELIKRYQIQQVIVSADSYAEVLKIISDENKLLVFGRGDRWLFGSFSGEVIWPPKADLNRLKSNQNNDKNERSLILRMVYGKSSVWFAGDSDCETESELMRLNAITESTYLKIGHHGSKTSTCEPFLAILRPHQAWISVGNRNKYGHPNQEVLDRLEIKHIEVLRTDKVGEINVLFK